MSIKKMYTGPLVLTLILVLTSAMGCQKKGEEVPLNEPAVAEQAPMPPLPSRIEVPEEVAARWKAVIVAVIDKATSGQREFMVDIGEKAPLGETGLTLLVEAFLPAFQMAGGVYSSSSADPVNPAAKVKINDGTGTLLFDGWLFGMYPDTHPFGHEKYAVILKGYVPHS